MGEAADGATAYEMIQEKKPDIVITDIRMPGLNGVELMRKARENGIKWILSWSADIGILSMPQRRPIRRFGLSFKTHLTGKN
ncbi:MAG: response regulator [Enterocloster sp.]